MLLYVIDVPHLALSNTINIYFFSNIKAYFIQYMWGETRKKPTRGRHTLLKIKMNFMISPRNQNEYS